MSREHCLSVTLGVTFLSVTLCECDIMPA